MTNSAVPVAPNASKRAALAAGLAFLEGSASLDWEVRDLCAWFREHLVGPGYMMTPLMVTEPSAGTVPLYGHTPACPCTLRRILAAARTHVLGALRGLIASPVDDRFLAASIFAGCVRRERVRGVTEWRPRPDRTKQLSGIVLGLFAVDVLSHREIYDQLLSVCDTCDRVTFHEGARRSCVEHQPHASGFTRSARPEALAMRRR